MIPSGTAPFSPQDRLWSAGRLFAVALFTLAQLYLGADDAPVGDEARHLRDGAALLRDGRIEINPEHPPLVKMLAAAMLPPAARDNAGAEAVADPMSADGRFAVSLGLTGARLLRVRLPVILLGVLGVLAFGGLFARLSPAAGFGATVWIVAAPPWLAHSHYVTTDMVPVAFLLLAAWAVWRHPNLAGAALSGAFLGAALVSKFAAPLLLPFALAWVLLRTRVRGLVVAAAVCVLVFLGVEAYASRGMSGADLRALSHRAFLEGGLSGPAPPSPQLDRFCGALVAVNRPLAAYAIGFFDIVHRSATNEWADYWAGRIVTGPQPLYPLETLALKTDIALLFAGLAGAALLLSRPRKFQAGAVLALAAGLLYLAAACRSSLHLGIRHLLPLVVLFCGFAVVGFDRARWRKAFLALAVAHVALAVFAFPHYVSYRNALGRLALEDHSAYDLGDDWGQDLGRFLRRQQTPVVYLSVIAYRNADWRRLFPDLREDGEDRFPYLVDAVGLDLLKVSRRSDLPPIGGRKLSAMRPILDRIETVLQRGSLRETSEPTLLLIERRPAREQ